jgi:hypothetical protein
LAWDRLVRIWRDDGKWRGDPSHIEDKPVSTAWKSGMGDPSHGHAMRDKYVSGPIEVPDSLGILEHP